MARSKLMHSMLSTDTLAGAIKLAVEDKGLTLSSLAVAMGMKPCSLRARLCKSRGKRALQPWQISNIAKSLGVDECELHRLAARHEGWKV